MKQETVYLTKTTKAQLVTYTGTNDLARFIKARPDKYTGDVRTSWAGGTRQDFYDGCKRGNVGYARKAEKLVDEFANLALEDTAHTLDYNTQIGALDYEAAMAGDPMCMYGMTMAETDTAPINIYVDQWISCTVPIEQIERRGIAVLALVQALSVYRSVNVTIVYAQNYLPKNQDQIQILPVPTAPMDLSMAAWMLCSPVINRQGLFQTSSSIAKCASWCSGPLLSLGREWQETQLGNWLSEHDNNGEAVFLPLMMGSSYQWETEASTLQWVKDHLARFAW